MNKTYTAKSNGRLEVHEEKELRIAAPKLKQARFHIIGSSPLVIKRRPIALLDELLAKQEGRKSSKVKNRTNKSSNKQFRDARYIARHGGWDGFNAAAIRNALLSVAKISGAFKTHIKITMFAVAEGWDKFAPQIPLIRIHGEPEKQLDIALVSTGGPYVTVRAAYHKWEAYPIIRWDDDAFKCEDIANMLVKIGKQIGIGEGRYDSKNSGGMGWGLFELATITNEQSV